MDALGKTIFFAVIALFAITWIAPLWPFEQALHSSLTVLGLMAIWFYAKKCQLSHFNLFLLCLFIAIHCVAARWLYSNVPYDAWIKSLSGVFIQKTMGWQRNHFDRLIHFLYGFCLVPTLLNHFWVNYTRNAKHCMLFAVSAIMLTSLCYEWFEWLIAATMSANSAEAYNGQQGDMWDAHKDMLLATIGALIWLPFYKKLIKLAD
jgi:putative membrane protein